MLILLSPAKTMDMSPLKEVLATTSPLFKEEAAFLASRMQTYTREQLQLLLQISNKLTDINYERYRDFDDPSFPGKPALFAYNGSVYRHLRPQTFSSEDFHYAQDHVRIISILYGLVRPLDRIKAYRIAYKLNLNGMQEKDLYAYWLPKLTDPLIKAVRKSGNLLINLASLDVLGALQMDKLEKKVHIITPEFKEYRNGKYETIRTYAKMARGEMSRYILLNRLEDPEKIKDFTWDNFNYCPKLSDEHKYVFLKS